MNVRLRVVAVYLAVLFTAQAEVTVKEGAYHDLVVSFSPNVNATNGETIVESLENLFTETSAVLQKAIGLRIASVTFHLPSTWDTSTWENKTLVQASVLSEDQRDLVVDNTVDSAFGTLPTTLQYGGCGVPGRRLTVPVGFLDENTEDFPKEQHLAREWLKFRYGVFDENGFDGDDMYPLYYNIPGTTEARITECTDPEVEYYFRDTDGNNCSLEIPFASSTNCEIHPKEISQNTTSSLMYYHKELTNMIHVCGKEHNHTDSTPNKQNVLCSGQSIWKILEKSGDFNGETKSEDPQSEDEEIKFSYRQEVKPRVVLAYENSYNLHDEGHIVLFAIFRFLYSLPDGSEFGMYSFKNQLTEIKALSQLQENREMVISPQFKYNKPDICHLCALDKAVEALSSKTQVTNQNTIILITASNSFDINDALFDKYKDVCLKILVLRRAEETVVDYDKLIPSSSCHSISVIEKAVPVSLIFEQLYKNLQNSVTQSPTDTRVSEVKAGVMSDTISLKFNTHSTASKYTLWMNQPMDLNEIICTKTDGNSIKLASSVHSSNIASFTFDPVDDLQEVNCNLEESTEAFALVEKTSKPGEYIDGEVWVDDPSNGKQMPVILYAKINYGSYPVQDATVTAMVIINGTIHKLKLVDNGRGDPDITEGDGIYSRYFVDLSNEGEYKVIVTASDNGGDSQVAKKGQSPCCGSKVKSTPEKAGFFIKSFKTSFHAKRKPEKGFKPSRVFDLRVSTFDPQNYIILNWTAPGGEADKGNASSYEFFVFCKSGDCQENGQVPQWITFISIPIPSMSGMENFAVLLLTEGAPTNETISFYLQTKNSNGLISELSNVVKVKLGEVSQPPIIDPTDIFPIDSGLSQTTIRAIVGGSVLGLFVLICIAFLAYNSAKKIRGQRARDIPKSECLNHGFADSTKDLKNINTRDSLSKENDATNYSANLSDASNSPSNKINDTREGSSKKTETIPVVLYTHDQIRHIKEKTNTPPLYGANVGPKPWMSSDSSSRKINKEEDSKSEDSASTLPANETDYAAEEVKQFNDNTLTSELPVEKGTKF